MSVRGTTIFIRISGSRVELLANQYGGSIRAPRDQHDAIEALDEVRAAGLGIGVNETDDPFAVEIEGDVAQAVGVLIYSLFSAGRRVVVLSWDE